MMRNPYLFGVHNGHVSAEEATRIREVADAEDVDFYQAEGRCWFSSRREQLGEPFDRALARSVYRALEAADIVYPPE